ncbi:GPI inositol deacylase [Mortierella sp. NVP85]|nr:GPI inositol deacylase [Mortierella sp. NVP85]
MDPKGCLMSYMYPAYYRILGLDQEKTPLAGKYGLLLYRYDLDEYPPSFTAVEPSQLIQTGDHDWNVPKPAKIKLRGSPALFIPGNAGSAKQVRTLAKQAWTQYHLMEREKGSRPGTSPLDFFAVDLNGEFSAFHGQLLLDQARYVNEAIVHILSLYDDAEPGIPRPTSVLIVGHSMGGIVARTIFTMDNYLPGSVNAILTLATPHMVPPVALGYEITQLYDRIEDFWRQGYNSPHGPLANVSLVSIMGGYQDTTVNSDAGNIHHIVPQSHGFSVFTSSIPHTWVSCDHLAILWCNQATTAIGRALNDVIDTRRPDRVKPLQERMKVLRSHFLSGAEVAFSSDISRPEMLSLSKVSHTFEDRERIWAYPRVVERKVVGQTASGNHYYILELPRQEKLDTFKLLTSCMFGSGCSLTVLLCNTGSAVQKDRSSDLTLSCERNRLSAVPVPESVAASTTPLFEGDRFTGREYRFISKRLSDLTEFQYIVIEEQRPEDKFLIIEFVNEADTIHTVQTSTLELLRGGLVLDQFPAKPTLVTTLRLPKMDNSMLAYNLKIHSASCQGSSRQRFQPMLRQSSWTLNEDKYIVNIASKASGVDINFHGDLLYFDKVLLHTSEGIDLQLWTDPTCSEQLSLTLTVDKFGSLGKLIIPYRTSVLVFTFMVVVLTVRTQILDWSVDGVFKPFGVILGESVKWRFWQFSFLLGVVSVIQSLKSKAMVHLDPDTLTDHGHMKTESHLRHWSAWFDNALLGRNDPIFWFMAPVLFQIAVGIVAFVWFFLNSIVRATGFVIMAVTKTTDDNLSSRDQSGGMATTFMFLVTIVLPYRFAFAVAFVTLIIISVRALVIAQRMANSQAWDRFHFAMAMLVMFFFLLPFATPSLMVWIRNLGVGWYKSFASDHRIDYVAPFVIFVEGLANGTAVTKTTWKRYATLTVILLDAMLVYLVIFAVRYGWQIYFLTRAWISWLVLLRFMETGLGSRIESRIRRIVWKVAKDD